MMSTIETRELAFKIASKACETLQVNVTAEKLWSLVEAITPVLEAAHNSAAGERCGCENLTFVDKPATCPVCGLPRLAAASR